MCDCSLMEDVNYFRFRVGALVRKDGKMLFVKSSADGHLYTVGGAVKIGETTEEAMLREFFEETGLRAKINHLGVVCECFFTAKRKGITDAHCHTVEFLYVLDVDSTDNCNKINDEGEPLEWVPLDDLHNRVIKPYCLNDKSDKLFASDHILHIVETLDR